MVCMGYGTWNMGQNLRYRAFYGQYNGIRMEESSDLSSQDKTFSFSIRYSSRPVLLTTTNRALLFPCHTKPNPLQTLLSYTNYSPLTQDSSHKASGSLFIHKSLDQNRGAKWFGDVFASWQLGRAIEQMEWITVRQPPLDSCPIMPGTWPIEVKPANLALSRAFAALRYHVLVKFDYQTEVAFYGICLFVGHRSIWQEYRPVRPLTWSDD